MVKAAIAKAAKKGFFTLLKTGLKKASRKVPKSAGKKARKLFWKTGKGAANFVKLGSNAVSNIYKTMNGFISIAISIALILIPIVILVIKMCCKVTLCLCEKAYKKVNKEITEHEEGSESSGEEMHFLDTKKKKERY